MQFFFHKYPNLVTRKLNDNQVLYGAALSLKPEDLNITPKPDSLINKYLYYLC